MKLLCLIAVVLLSLSAIISLADGADIDMYISSSSRVAVNKDLSSTYGMKFCVRSDHGIILTFVPKQGVYTAFFRYLVEVGNTDPDWTNIRPLASSSVDARSYQTGLVNFDTSVCFWTIWLNNWYFVGTGSVWGQQLLMNYRNLSQAALGGVFAQTKLSGQQAYLTIIDESISQADAQTATASALYVPQTFAGPVKKTSDPNEVTTVTVTTTSGGAYKDLGISLSGFTSLSMKVTTNSQLFGAYILLYDKNNVDLVNRAYEINPYRYRCAFSLGKGMNKTMTYNINNYGMDSSATEQTFWVSWADGRYAAGMGDTTGVGTVVAWDDSNPVPINAVMIKSKDMDVTFTIAKRYYDGTK